MTRAPRSASWRVASGGDWGVSEGLTVGEKEEEGKERKGEEDENGRERERLSLCCARTAAGVVLVFRGMVIRGGSSEREERWRT